VWKLPVIFVCQNNQYAEYTALAEYTLTEDLSKRAAAYEMPGIRVDGTDPVAVYEATAAAVARARAGEGPTLIEAVCHRLQGHAFGSEETHMDQTALAAARSTPPVAKFRTRLLGRRARRRGRAQGPRDGHPQGSRCCQRIRQQLPRPA
jgi:TPP-dependent pyruvate/acetoin dehydrogenase alpha subunit